MSFLHDSDRRTFLRATAVALATGRFTMLRSWQQPLHSIDTSAATDELSALRSATAWINSTPLTATALKGKVVLVQFWTFTCINWLRTLPYTRAWEEAYKNAGLVVIGVHTPEFSFEHNLENVRRAARELRVNYPIAVDSDYAVWRGFNNQYWPALYLVDGKGRVRHHHFGEGEYAESERKIQELLKEAGAHRASDQLSSVEGQGIEAPADWAALQSQENYVGDERTEGFASPGGAAPGRRRSYALPRELRLNQWALAGDWTIDKEAITLNEPNGRIGYRFHGRDLNLVMGPPAGRDGGARTVRFRVLLDGQPAMSAHGSDVDAQGNGLATSQRLYQLIRQPKPIVDRVFEIEYLDPGVQAFSFTFG
jgi:thiol-disulfide isomerase/thioredoxin